MNRLRPLCLGLWAGGCLFAAAQQVETLPSAPQTAPVPSRLPTERYQMLWERSPFEIPVAAESAPATGIRAEWLLASLSRTEGKPFAVLVSKSTGESVVVRQDQETAQGFTLIEAVIAPHFHQSRAIIRRGAETVELQFQEQELAGLVAVSAASQAPPSPGGSGSTTQPGTPGANSFPNPANPPRPPSRIIRRSGPVTPPAPL